jgi:hypothetical protein
MAFTLTFGGIVNLTGMILVPVVLAFVFCGIALWLVSAQLWLSAQLRKTSFHVDQHRLVYLFLALFVCGLGLIILGEFAHGRPQFNDHDDFFAYLLFPIKMLALGSLTPDPFNVHQMYALGGQSFLQVLVLVFLPIEYVKIADPGLSLLVLAALIFGQLRQHQTGPFETALVTSLPLLLLPVFPNVNISALASLMCMFFAMYRTLDWPGLEHSNIPCRAFTIALVTAGLISLKATALPFAAITLAVSYLVLLIRAVANKDALLESLMAAALTALFLAPWMVMMHLSSGTFFYPVLGLGFSGEAYGTFPVNSNYFQWRHFADDPNLFLVIALFFLSAPHLPRAYRAPLLSVVAGTVIATLMVHWARAGHGRSTFPFTMTALLALIGYLAHAAPRRAQLGAIVVLCSSFAFWGQHIPFQSDIYYDNERPDIGPIDFAFAVSASVVFVVILLPNFFRSVGIRHVAWGICLSLAVVILIINLERRSENPKDHSASISKVRVAQSSIPDGETFLAKIAEPFLLDFKRNRIFIVSWAHGSSLPPGMPFRKGSEAFAEYFLSKSVRYILYQPNYDYFPGDDPKCRTIEGAAEVVKRTIGNEANQCGQELSMADFLGNLARLMKTRKLLYDDGEMIVIDLKEPR